MKTTGLPTAKAPSQEQCPAVLGGERLPDASEDIPTCRHHFVVETPNGATVAAVCKHCHLERTYPTAGVDMHWREWRDGAAPPTTGGWDRSL